MHAFAYGAGMIPEQVWDRSDLRPTPGLTADDESVATGRASIGFANGGATGSAGPLDWGMAQYVRLAADLAAGRLLDRPAVVAARYAGRPLPPGPALTLSSPSVSGHDGSALLRVSGRASPGGRVMAALYRAMGRALLPVRTRSDGRFDVSVPLGPGKNKLLVVAVAPGRSATVARRTVSG